MKHLDTSQACAEPCVGKALAQGERQLQMIAEKETEDSEKRGLSYDRA